MGPARCARLGSGRPAKTAVSVPATIPSRTGTIFTCIPRNRVGSVPLFRAPVAVEDGHTYSRYQQQHYCNNNNCYSAKPCSILLAWLTGLQMTFPYVVRLLAGKARGIVTTRRVAAGSLLWKEVPLAAAAAFASIPAASPAASATLLPTSRCSLCLRPLQVASKGLTASQSIAAVPTCTDCSTSVAEILAQCGGETEESCQEQDRVFPVLTKRIAVRTLAAASASASPLDLKAVDESLSLAHAALTSDQLLAFRDDHARLQRDLAPLAAAKEGSVDALGYFAEAWYCRLMTALNLNAFSVADGDGRKIGSAVFVFTSLLNHSCRPSAAVEFPRETGASVAVRATRDLEVDEEILIDYLCGHSIGSRAEFLHNNYGFRCAECLQQPGHSPRCVGCG